MTSEFNLGKATSDFLDAIGVGNWNPSETIDQIKNVPSQIQQILVPPVTIHMNAEDLKKRTIEELYRQVKQKVVEQRYECECVVSWEREISDGLLGCLIEKLVDEGFQVKVIDSEITISW